MNWPTWPARSSRAREPVASDVAVAGFVARPGGVRAAFRVERRKLASQLAPRLLALICVLGPFAFSAVLKVQSGSPADALYGGWVHSSGFAVSLVVLGFAGQRGLPLMAGVLAGDLFGSEDRHGTWKTVLTTPYSSPRPSMPGIRCSSRRTASTARS